MQTTVDAMPLVTALQPYLLAVVSALASALIGLVCAYVSKRLGIDVDQSNRDAIHAAAMTAAGGVLAKLNGDLATRKIDVGDPLVATGIAYVENQVPAALARFGLTPDAVEKIILGKIGQLQAQAFSQASAQVQK